MRTATSILFRHPESLQSRPNVFGELMRVIISPSQAIQEAVCWVLKGADPDIVLHMCMMTNRQYLAIETFSELCTIHKRNYIHRDIKPDNMLLDRYTTDYMAPEVLLKKGYGMD